MKKMQIVTVILTLLSSAALTACGTDSTTGNSTPSVTTEVVTTAAETTAGGETETIADAATTTAKETDAAETTEAEENETTTEAETTAAQQETETPATEAPQQTDAPATDAPKQEQHLFDSLKIGSSPADYVAAHPVKPNKSDSCLVGTDLEYTYPDFVLVANENNGVEKVVRIRITGSGISTREGIHIGSSLDDVKNAYGAGDSDDFISKTTADGLLEIELENGVVTAIDLSKE